MSPETASTPEPVAYRSTATRRLQQLSLGTEPPVGTHLVTPAFGFAHPGIYAGNGRVIHYGALMYDIIRKPVEEVSFESFAENRPVFVVQHAEACLAAELVIERARSRLGEKRYRLFTNNCEHFVEWCLHDTSRSFQAETALAYPRLVAERLEAAMFRLYRRMVAAVRPALRLPARVPVEKSRPDFEDDSSI